MKVLKVSKKYLVESQLFVSIVGTSLAVFFMINQDIVRLPSILLIFITYFSGYIYTKYQGRKDILIKILAFNTFCGLISIFLILNNHNVSRLWRWSVIVIIGLLYDSYFLKYFIRKIPLFKVFYVGLTWALINSWLILPEMHWPIFIISWLFVTALVLPFDIRDMKQDDVITFPQLIGVQNTKYLAYVLIFISVIFAIQYLDSIFSASIYLTAIITFLMIYFSENKRRDYYFSFWVESCSLMPLLFFYILKYFW